MLLITTGLWAQAGAEGHGKKATAKPADGEEQTLLDIENKSTELIGLAVRRSPGELLKEFLHSRRGASSSKRWTHT